MELIQQQFPHRHQCPECGLSQTLKLFFVTLIGAIPLGLIISFGSGSSFKPLSLLCRFIVWVVRGTPLMIQLLIFYYFPGMVLKNNIWGSGEAGALVAAAISYHQLRLLLLRDLSGRHSGACPRGSRRPVWCWA